MDVQQLVFSIIAVVTLVSAFIVVTDRNLFHAALAMMLSFLGVAGFYVLLGAGFMAAAQLLVYIGAISILIIFAIMMTRRLMSADESPFNCQLFFSFVVSVIVFALFSFAIWNWWAPLNLAAEYNSVSPERVENSVIELGRLFVSADGYVLPFELSSILLLAALIGSIVVAMPIIKGKQK